MYWSIHQGKDWVDKVNKLFIVWPFHYRPEPMINKVYTWEHVILYPWLKCPLWKMFIKPFSLGNFAWKAFRSWSSHCLAIRSQSCTNCRLSTSWPSYLFLKQNCSLTSLSMHRWQNFEVLGLIVTLQSPLLPFPLPPVFFHYSLFPVFFLSLSFSLSLSLSLLLGIY